jgi:5'-3' exonuclease, N-terminal resolvase-like domain
MPDNLRSQINDISKMISMLKIDIVEVAGYEADDVL